MTSVVVLHYGEWSYTQACITAVRATCDTEIVLVCNSEAPDDPDADVLLRNPRNVGFARGCNQGFRHSGSSTVVFLNNDTEPQPGWLEDMTAWLDRPRVAVVGARLTKPNGELQHTAVAVDFTRPPGQEAWEVTSRGPGDCQAVTGACMAVNADLWCGFDEAYVNGYEDVDACLEMTQRGFRVVTSSAQVMHHVNASGPGERFREAPANIRRLRMKWGHG